MAAAPHVRLATGFRWPLRTAATTRDLVRVWVDDGVSLLAVGNGYETGFSSCWPTGSRLLLDRLEVAWAAGSGPVGDRLLAAFEEARAAFIAEAAVLVPYEDDFDAPGATLHVVALDGAEAHAVWIGGERTIVARGFRVAAATTPHTLTERFHAEGREPPPPHLARIIVRSIRPDDREPPAVACFALRPGDTVIVAGQERPPVDELAAAAGGYLSPAILAERIVAAGADDHFAAAAVARIDGFDLAATVEALVDAYVPDPWDGPRLGDWARAERALPVWRGLETLAIRGDGAVVGYDPESPAPTRLEHEAIWHRVAILAAARHSALAALAPTRPPDAADCWMCVLKYSLMAGRCGACQGLGWDLPELPAWLGPAPPQQTG